MKQISKHTLFTIMAAVALSLFSCTKDDGKDAVSDPNAIQKTDVVANIVTSNSSTTAKDVNRGSIYAWVSTIDVTASSSAWSYSKSEHFVLVASGGESNFKISDVALGLNNFSAVTTTNTAPVKALVNIPTGDASVVRAALVAHNPYAIYTGNTTGVNILSTALNNINLNMNTQHGRVIAVFKIENDAVLKANTQAKITVKIDDVEYATSGFLSNDGLVTFEWSDAQSLAGKKVDYVISIYDKSTVPVLITSYPVTASTIVKGSTSISCTYEINRERVINTNPDELKFVWQQWVEQNCEVTYDNEGYNCLGYDKDGYDRGGHNREGFDKCGWHKAPNVFYNPEQDKDLSDLDSKAKCGGN